MWVFAEVSEKIIESRCFVSTVLFYDLHNAMSFVSPVLILCCVNRIDLVSFLAPVLIFYCLNRIDLVSFLAPVLILF